MDKVQYSSDSQRLLNITSNMDELSLAKMNDVIYSLTTFTLIWGLTLPGCQAPKSLSHFPSQLDREEKI